MSREQDEKELRKLEYLDKRGVATFSDTKRRKDLARKLAIEAALVTPETAFVTVDATKP